MNQPEQVIQDLNQPKQEHLAALDLGSNSFHLVVTRVVSGTLQIVHRVKRRVQLAQGLDKDNMLSEEAIARGLEALRSMQESLQGFAPEHVRIVATFTLRKARNAYVFIHAAKKILPYPVEVISGVEEARLIYSGVAHTHFDDGRRLIIDIGGGSTEFVIGDGFKPKICRSLQMGCVSYTQRFFPRGKITKKNMAAAVIATRQTLELIEDKYIRLKWHECIGTSGTIKSILQLLLSRQKTDFMTIKLSDLKALRKEAVELGNTADLPINAVSPDRAEVFPAGLAILLGIFKSLKIKEMVFSSSALREGVIYEMHGDLFQSETRERTAQSLANRYDIDPAQAARVWDTVNTLYKQAPASWLSKKRKVKSLLAWSCLLHEVGIAINSQGFQRHSQYIIQNTEMPGFNVEEQLLLGTLTRFCRKKIKPDLFAKLEQFSVKEVQRILILLRLGVLLNIKRQSNILPEYTIDFTEHEIAISFADGWLEDKPIFTADLAQEKKYLEVLDIKLSVS